MATVSRRKLLGAAVGGAAAALGFGSMSLRLASAQPPNRASGRGRPPGGSPAPAAASGAAAAATPDPMRTGTAPFGTGLGAESVDLGNGFRILAAGRNNVLAVPAGEGIALVDGGSAADSSGLLRRVADLAGNDKVHTLFNTHWHPEQTGSNETLAKAGAAIVAQENTRLWLTTDVTWPWNGETVQPLPKAAQPNKTFYTTETLMLGDTRVECGYLRDCPHTDGDMYVFFPDQNVLAVGGAVTGAGWPSIDWWTGGWIGGVVGGLDTLLTVANSETRIVPSTGPVLSRADLLDQYRMYGLIWERLLKTLYSGGGPEEAHAIRPTAEFDAIMGPSEDFVQRAFESLWAYLSPDA